MASLCGHSSPDTGWGSDWQKEGGAALFLCCPCHEETWPRLNEGEDIPSGDSNAPSDDEDMSECSPTEAPFELLPGVSRSEGFSVGGRKKSLQPYWTAELLEEKAGSCTGMAAGCAPVEHPPGELQCMSLYMSAADTAPRTSVGTSVAPEPPSLRDLTLQHLKVVSLLGAGAYGKVFLVEDTRTKARYALKHLSKAVAVQIPRNLIDEVRAMSAAEGCPFTARLLKTFVDDSAFHLLQDAILGGELFNRVLAAPRGRLDEETARFYLACAVITLSTLHGRGLLHRDVKPENMLIDEDGFLRLVDFGSACKYGPGVEARRATFCGTPDYLAPEVLLQRFYEWGPAADSWALGVTLFFMVTGRLPFAVPEANKTVGTDSPRLADPRFTFPADVGLSVEGRDLVSQLLLRHPRERLGGGPTGAMAIKEHPWFVAVDWAVLERRAVSPPPNPGARAVPAGGADRTDRDMLPGCSAVDTSDPVTAAILARLDTFFGEEKWREERELLLKKTRSEYTLVGEPQHRQAEEGGLMTPGDVRIL